MEICSNGHYQIVYDNGGLRMCPFCDKIAELMNRIIKLEQNICASCQREMIEDDIGYEP